MNDLSSKELDAALSALGERDVDPWRRESIRRHAHEGLVVRRTSHVAQAYRRYFEPALVSALCALHLVWAFGAAAALLLR